MKKNDEIELDIDGFTAEGNGVGRSGGLAVFVAGTAPGDRVRAHIIKVKKNYSIGIVKNILRASACRTEPDCPVFSRCGGCCFRHIDYESELKEKRKRVDDAFYHIGGLHVQTEDILPSPQTDGYRNKSLLPIGKDASGRIVAGYFSQKSHRIIPATGCRLHPGVFDRITERFLSFANRHSLSVYDEKTGQGLLRHLYIRRAEKTGQIMVCPVINGDGLPYARELIDELTEKENITCFLLNINSENTNVVLGGTYLPLYGEPYIEDILCGRRVRLSPGSFYQVNALQAQRLYEKAAEYAGLTGSETLLDLYCGTGTIGLSMAAKVKRLIGVEIVRQAVEDAARNAELNGITNATFLCADAAKAAQQFKQQGIQPDVVLLDPPRKGCAPELLQTVAGMSPEKIVYISCDPATLARDAAALTRLGYEIKKACAADMFPRTGHVETVVLMSKKDNE